jgi:hypothetical protein
MGHSQGVCRLGSIVPMAALSIALAAGCSTPVGRPDGGAAVPLSAAVGRGVTATFVIDSHGSSLHQRGVLYVEPTNKVRVTVEGPDLSTPFTTDQTLSSLAGGVSLTVKNIPPGAMRVVTLQWLDEAGNPIDGLYYRAQGTLDLFNRKMIFNNFTTAEGEVMLSALKRHAAQAALLKPDDVDVWMGAVIATAAVPNPRFLNFDAVADGIIGLSTKNFPTPKPEWRVDPGFVAVGFTDIQKGLKLRVSVSDSTSGAAVTDSGDTLVIGPIPPRDAPYKLRVTAVASNGEDIGSDLVMAPVDVVVKAGQTLQRGAISLANSTAGAPLPARVGRGAVATIDGADAQIWVLNGVKYPDGNPTDIGSIATNPVTASSKAYRYRRSDGWTSQVNLPLDFPLYGAATAVFGTQVFCFGGFVNTLPTNAVFALETTGTPALKTAGIALPAADGEAKLKLAGAVAATVGDRIYLAGGLAHDLSATNPDGTPSSTATDPGLGVTLAFNPATSSWDPNPLPAPPVSLQAMAGAVVGQKWFCFGGFHDEFEPLDVVQIFDATSKTWSKGSHPMPTARYGCATAVVGDKIWVIGGEIVRGEATRAVEVYDPAKDSWTRRAPLRTPCSFAAAGAVHDGSNTKIVVAAGVAGASFLGFPLPLGKSLGEELTP